MCQRLCVAHDDEFILARVIAALVKGCFVDDERFARAFANDKVRYNKWGRHKIDQALCLGQGLQHGGDTLLPGGNLQPAGF